MASDDRFSMTTEKYLARHQVLVYMEDAVAQLLEHREENSKINPIKFLCEYFNSVRDGNHTMFREYSYIHATPHNRASFVRLFWKCYRQIGKKGDLLSIQEYHSLLSLLCSDFPFEPVQKTAKIILLDDALDCLISFSDFIYAFQVQFYFEEFIEKSHDMYQSLHQTQRSPRDPVVVPSGSDDTKVHQNSHHPGDGVDATQYFRAIYPLCDRSNFSTPPVNVLKEILFNIPRVSFYGFLMAIAKSERINEHIGRLPSKAELLEGADADLTVQEAAIQNHVSPTVRLSNSTTASSKFKGHPISATTPSDAPQNVYPTQRSPSANQRKTPPSRTGAVNHSMKIKRGTVKKDSTDESSSDDTDDSSDTN